MKVEYTWKLFIVCGFIIASVTYVCSLCDKHKRKNKKQSKRAIKDGGMVIIAGAGVVLAMAATTASGDVP